MVSLDNAPGWGSESPLRDSCPAHAETTNTCHRVVLDSFSKDMICLRHMFS